MTMTSSVDWASVLRVVATSLVGEPTRKTATEWRFRRRGSLSVNVAGEHAGQWFDFEAGVGGGGVDLVTHRSCLAAGPAPLARYSRPHCVPSSGGASQTSCGAGRACRSLRPHHMGANHLGNERGHTQASRTSRTEVVGQAPSVASQDSRSGRATVVAGCRRKAPPQWCREHCCPRRRASGMGPLLAPVAASTGRAAHRNCP